MIRNLFIIGASGLALAIVGIGGAAAVGGSDLAKHSWTWVFDDNENDGVRVVREQLPAPITRTIEWAGGDSLAIDIPGKVVFIQDASASGITIEGQKELAEKVTLSDGRLRLDTPDRRGSDRSYVTWDASGIRGWNERERLTITIRAPSVKSFELFGHTNLLVRDYNQPDLKLALTGSADAEVIGRTQSITVDASGHASAELDELLTENATIRTSGNADVETSANGKVDVVATGNSSISFSRRPSELRQELSQEATVDQD